MLPRYDDDVGDEGAGDDATLSCSAMGNVADECVAGVLAADAGSETGSASSAALLEEDGGGGGGGAGGEGESLMGSVGGVTAGSGSLMGSPRQLIQVDKVSAPCAVCTNSQKSLL